LIFLIGCSKRPEELQVGVHHITLVPPAGWLHADHGREHLYQRDLAKISILDLGAVDPDGFKREVEAARALWRSGQNEVAANRLWRLPVCRNILVDREFHETFVARVSDVTPGGAILDSLQTELGYADMIALLEALPEPSVEELVPAALAELGYDERRDIASLRPIVIGGRPGLQVDTWDRLSHQFPKRYALVLNGGYLLVVRTAYGPFEECEPAFDRIVASLAFTEPTAL
jgi:hypothetical protein